MIQAVKHNEQARKEYSFMSAFEMDAREEGIQQGIKRGIQQGFSDGAYQAKLETAAAFKRLGIDIAKIAEGTGLSCEEIEKL